MLLTAFGNPRVQIILWNGEAVCTSAEPPVANMRIADRATLVRLCADPDLQFGEGYSAGTIDVEGDLELLIEELYHGGAASSASNAISLARRIGQRLHRRPTNTLTGSRHNIHHHYDLGNEFYSLWLDETMVYTCAYFPTREGRSMKRSSPRWITSAASCVCDPGETVVEAGCGWGSLALHMARHYGVHVRAFNISREQIRVRARAARRRKGSIDRRRVHRGRLPQHHRFVRRVRLGRHARACRRRELPGARPAHSPLPEADRSRSHPLDRPQSLEADASLDRSAHFPGREPAVAPADDGHLRRVQVLGARRGESPSALREDARRLGRRSSSNRRTASRRCSTNGSCGCGGCTCKASIAAFRTGEHAALSGGVRSGRNNEIPWTREDLYRGAGVNAVTRLAGRRPPLEKLDSEGSVEKASQRRMRPSCTPRAFRD